MPRIFLKAQPINFNNSTHFNIKIIPNNFILNFSKLHEGGGGGGGDENKKKKLANKKVWRALAFVLFVYQTMGGPTGPTRL